MPPSVNSLPPQRELPDGVGGLVSAASFSFADSADASMSIENPDDDDMLLSEQMPIDLLETSFQIEDLTTIMRPSMMSSSSSSISSFESASAESPMPSPPAVRHRLVTTKAPTPLKQVFSLADPHSSPSKDAEQADSSQSRPQSQSQSPVRPLGFAPSQPQTDVPAASAGSPTRALSLNMSFDEHMASAGPQSQASSAASHPSGHTAPAAEQSQSSQNVQSLLDQTPVAKRVQGLAEFDPLAAIPQDWMMKFETPAPARTGTQRGPAQPSAHSLSLLDDIGPLATPNSIPKFTQRDMDKTKKEMQTTFEKEFELAQLEIHDLTLGAEALREDNRRMRETLSQWEQAVKLMIAEKDKDKHQKQAEIDELTKQLQKTREERDLARKEADQVSLKYKQLRVDVSDMKEIDERQRAQIGELEKSVEVANKRFDSLRAHAEAKLEEANVKIERVRSTYEKEIAALRAKLSRMEVQTQTLERNLQTKTQENQELTKICDDLVSQMEQMSG
nr:Transforming acidic coiled-coil-containing protein 3 [Polyrhizophydium stewartii]